MSASLIQKLTTAYQEHYSSLTHLVLTPTLQPLNFHQSEFSNRLSDNSLLLRVLPRFSRGQEEDPNSPHSTLGPSLSDLHLHTWPCSCQFSLASTVFPACKASPLSRLCGQKPPVLGLLVPSLSDQSLRVRGSLPHSGWPTCPRQPCCGTVTVFPRRLQRDSCFLVVSV